MSTTKASLVVKNSPLSYRLEPHERKALDAAVRQTDRSRSWLTRRVLIDWLQKEGYLSEANEAVNVTGL